MVLGEYTLLHNEVQCNQVSHLPLKVINDVVSFVSRGL